jgi:hypothetical protein
MPYPDAWDVSDPTSRSHVPPGRPKARCKLIGDNAPPQDGWRLPPRWTCDFCPNPATAMVGESNGVLACDDHARPYGRSPFARGVFEAPRPKPLAEHELPAEGTN